MSFRSPNILERYVLRESILPFVLGFSLVTFLFYMDFLFDFLSLLLSKGVPAMAVLELFLLAIGWIVALSVPCGVLVSALMTFGRMSQDNEITAMRGLGVNVARVMRAPLLAAVIVATLMTGFNHFILPETNHRFANLMLAIHRKRPPAELRAGIFNNSFDDYSLLVKSIDQDTGTMHDITIFDYSGGTVPTTILAASGSMELIEQNTGIRLDLHDGEIHVVPGTAAEHKYRRGSFATHTLILRNAGALFQRTDRQSRSDREMNVTMMLGEIRRLDEQREKRQARLDEKASTAGYGSYDAFVDLHGPPRPVPGLMGWLGRLLRGSPAGSDSSGTVKRTRDTMLSDLNEIEGLERRTNAFRVEIHKKFSIPFACIVFVLVGAPLGIRTRKGGFANMAIAVAIFVLYYLFLIGGEQLADRRIVPPAVSMWLPNFVFGILGLWLTASVAGWGRSKGMR